MKIVFLNAWHAHNPGELTEFFKQQVHDTDIFCFQEAPDAVKALYKDIFTDYQELSDYKYVTDEDDYPQVTLVRNGIEIISSESLFSDDNELGLTLYTALKVGEKQFHLCNVHGNARPNNKLDSPGRIKQSEAFIERFKDTSDPVIIGGDFNIERETESVKMFARHNYRDLISDYKIKTTRNHWAWDKYPGNELYYSDFVFTNSGIDVKNFTVIGNEISDHLPMILEFEI